MQLRTIQRAGAYRGRRSRRSSRNWTSSCWHAPWSVTPHPCCSAWGANSCARRACPARGSHAAGTVRRRRPQLRRVAPRPDPVRLGVPGPDRDARLACRAGGTLDLRQWAMPPPLGVTDLVRSRKCLSERRSALRRSTVWWSCSIPIAREVPAVAPILLCAVLVLPFVTVAGRRVLREACDCLRAGRGRHRCVVRGRHAVNGGRR